MAILARAYDVIRRIRTMAEGVRVTEMDAAQRVLGELERWNLLPLDPGWSPVGGFNAPEYMLDRLGWVSLRGAVQRTITPPGRPLASFTLGIIPVDYRPPYDSTMFAAVGWEGGHATAKGRLGVTAGGVVILSTADSPGYPGVSDTHQWYLGQCRWRVS